MTEQPEALRLADLLVEYLGADHPAVRAISAELRRLHEYELAYKTWNEKTQWVQDTLQPGELGLHRADGMKRRIERLHSVNAELLEALIHIGFAAMDITCERKTIRDAARAAIAKAEGRA